MINIKISVLIPDSTKIIITTYANDSLNVLGKLYLHSIKKKS